MIMVERVCPRCDAGNSSEQRYCGQCGSPLSQALAQRPASALTQRSIQIPARWKETGKVVALGVATVAAEVGLAWLQRQQQAPLARPRSMNRSQPQRARVIALGRRVSETWVGGQLQHRSEEQVMWMVPDNPQR
jgi:hypothetical protein